MAQANGAHRRNGRLTEKQVATILRRAFAHCLDAAAVSREQASREMGVRRYTVQRYLSGKSDVNAKFVLRARKLWRPFLLCVAKLCHEARRAA